jgi:hypothetical protein
MTSRCSGPGRRRGPSQLQGGPSPTRPLDVGPLPRHGESGRPAVSVCAEIDGVNARGLVLGRAAVGRSLRLRLRCRGRPVAAKDVRRWLLTDWRGEVLPTAAGLVSHRIIEHAKAHLKTITEHGGQQTVGRCDMPLDVVPDDRDHTWGYNADFNATNHRFETGSKYVCRT